MRSTRRMMLLLCVGIASLTSAARGEAPSGRYVIAAETVLDTVTGLTWQRGYRAGSSNGFDALTYCEDLRLGGSPGWRLPSIKELQSLVDVRASSPAIDTTAFPSTPAAGFWSSTPSAAGPYVAWMIDFNTGAQALAAVEFDLQSVRCVR